MKFKFLMIVLIIIILIVMLVIMLTPLFLAEPEHTLYLQYFSFPALVFLAFLLIFTSILFFINYRLYSLLEREDWPALAYYLEQKVFTKGRYSNKNVRLLASSYLVISDYVSTLKLENKAQLANPSVISKNVLLFGSARILNGNPVEASAFYKMHMEKCKAKDRQWVQWFYGFAQLLSGAFPNVEPEFTSLAFSSNDPLITGLSAYFLSSSIEKRSQNPDKCRLASKKGKDRVISSIKSIEGWKKETERFGTDIHIAIIKRYIDEAGKWLWSE